jgi:XTP/dITP diphosphohydrolase
MRDPILFATHNLGKIKEVRSLLGNEIPVISLGEAGFDVQIAEPFTTLEENARAKSLAVYRITGRDCFGEDSGLFVEVLKGAPGVRSARYAGSTENAGDNIRKLLEEMRGKTQREAYFRTVISLFWKEKEYEFDGYLEGIISLQEQGNQGFGYDPVFIPKSAGNRSLAEMSLSEKNLLSHRAKAFEKLKKFLLLWEG